MEELAHVRPSAAAAATVCRATPERLNRPFICTIMKWGQESVAVFALPSNWACVFNGVRLHYLADPEPHIGTNYKDTHTGEAGERESHDTDHLCLSDHD